tara:strand:- start:269 stop:436 length:168 start_codon:yes stop_codon:yes gene_type:complete
VSEKLKMTLPDEDVVYPKDYCVFENGSTGYETRDDCGCPVCVTYKPFDFFTRDLE